MEQRDGHRIFHELLATEENTQETDSWTKM